MERRSERAGAIALIVAVWVAPVAGQVTSRASVDSSGTQADGSSYYWSSISADGRYVAFMSLATDLVSADTNGSWDIFVRDRLSGQVSRESVDSLGAQADGDSRRPSISADGRYVAFHSFATDLVPGDTNGTWDVFVRDRLSGLTSRESVDSLGAQANGDSRGPSISTDGRYVAFHSSATDLVPGDTNGAEDVFVRDRASGQTGRESVDSSLAQANGESLYPSISADGRYVAFDSLATDLVPGDTNGVKDIFVRDRLSGQTSRASVDSLGTQANGLSWWPSISADGRYVAFWSFATDLVPGGDTNGTWDVFVRDLLGGQTSRESIDSLGAQANGDSRRPSISADGRYVAFHSFATDLVPGDTNGTWDVFVRDRASGLTSRASVDSLGAQSNGASEWPSISADGRYVGFSSNATNLVPGDTNGTDDIFVHDRDASGFTSFCNPGIGGVIPCPCQNPPFPPGPGCDNSSLTGGATLSATGVAYLSMDSLVFTTSGEKPTAASIVLQGDTSLPAGLVLGQGVRCVGGLLSRLYVKDAVGGSITAPDFGAGDPSVSARSAALGDPIQPGESRFYTVYYRDPIVLGGCPATSTFNTTHSGAVEWWP